MFHLRLTALLALGLLCEGLSSAQDRGCREQVVPVSVYSRNGTPVQQLYASNFAGSVGGKALQVSSAILEQQPHGFLVLLDSSGSMLKGNWNYALNLAKKLVEMMPSGTEVGFASFADGVENPLEPTYDHKKLTERIEVLRAAPDFLKLPRNTRLWDAVRRGVALLGPSEVGDAIYVITDGDDNMSKTKPEEVAQFLGFAVIRLFVFRLPLQEPSNRNQAIDAKALEQVAKDTGGLSVFSEPLSGLPERLGGPVFVQDLIDKKGNLTSAGMAVRLQQQQILSFYRLNLTLAGPVDKPRRWNLQLVSLDKSPKKDLVLNYPQMLAPCKGDATR